MELLDALKDSIDRVFMDTSSGVNQLFTLVSTNGFHSQRRKSVSKREKSTYTKKSHSVLNNIELRAKSCLDKVDALQSVTDFAVLEQEVCTPGLGFEGVTHRVPSIDGRRAVIGQLLVDINTKLNAVRSKFTFEQNGPFIFDSSAYFIFQAKLYY